MKIAATYLMQGLAFVFLVVAMVLAILAAIDGRLAFVVLNAVTGAVNFYLYCTLGDLRERYVDD